MRKYLDLIINIVFLLLLNIILTLTIYHDIELVSIIFYFLEALFFGSFIKLVASAFQKPYLVKTVNLILLIFITIMYASQFVYYSFYDSFYSIYSFLHGGQVFGFLEAILKIVIENIYGFSFFMILLVVIIPVIIKTPCIIFKRKSIITSLILVVSFGLNVLIANCLQTGIYSYYNLLHNTHNVALNVKKFGLLTSTVIDIKRYIGGFEPSLILEDEDKNDMNKNSDYNLTDINFDSLLKNEKDKRINDLDEYLQNESPTNKNKYTGIFKGKNLIFITAESLEFGLIDKDITPTLYKLKNEGFTFSNFYTPIYYASTSDGEYTNLTGLIPNERTWSYISSKDNYYPYSYAKVFKKLGYDTYSYHNGIYNFYDRDEVLKNFGFDTYKACGNGLEDDINCRLFPQSDEQMLTQSFNDYKDSKHFMAYYMTISGHLPHNFNTNDMAKKWYKETRNLEYFSHVKAYVSANIDLDKGLEQLLKQLKSNNLLEDTVIVIVPDHFPYGLNAIELSQLKELDTIYDKHKSGLIIYNCEIKGEKIEKYASNIDILPTLLNMFDIEYDSRLIIGKDIMSSSDGIVIFNDRSFLTDKGFYNASSNKFSNKKVSNEYVNQKKIEVYNKVNASAIMLDNDYYKRIGLK